MMLRIPLRVIVGDVNFQCRSTFRSAIGNIWLWRIKAGISTELVVVLLDMVDKDLPFRGLLLCRFAHPLSLMLRSAT